MHLLKIKALIPTVSRQNISVLTIHPSESPEVKATFFHITKGKIFVKYTDTELLDTLIVDHNIACIQTSESTIKKPMAVSESDLAEFIPQGYKDIRQKLGYHVKSLEIKEAS